MALVGGGGPTCRGPAVGAGNIGGLAGAPQESSVIGAAGGKEPQALVLPLWAMLGGSASEARGSVVRSLGRVHPPPVEGGASGIGPPR